jgi:hypothetical protein
MSSQRSEPRIYPLPQHAVFNAALAGLPTTKLKVLGADPAQGIIWVDKGMGLASWGEKVMVYVYPDRRLGPQVRLRLLGQPRPQLPHRVPGDRSSTRVPAGAAARLTPEITPPAN